MKDLGILMTPANREAIVEGRKGMTRRLCKVQPESTEMCPVIVIQDVKSPSGYSFYSDMIGEIHLKAPYAVGQRLYIKEPHYRYGKWLKNGLTKKTERQAWRFKPLRESFGIYFDAESVPGPIESARNKREGWYLRSPLFIPKEFARTWLLVTDVKAPERIQDISEEDAKAEGLPGEVLTTTDKDHEGNNIEGLFYYPGFVKLWESIYGEGSWDKNEWVWPIEFTETERE